MSAPEVIVELYGVVRARAGLAEVRRGIGGDRAGEIGCLISTELSRRRKLGRNRAGVTERFEKIKELGQSMQTLRQRRQIARR